MFSIKKEYTVDTRPIPLKDFHDYREKFIPRPPYQRKPGIWTHQMRVNLLDSICKRYYIPRIVLRHVQLSKTEAKLEVIDGQQRINTIQMFYEGRIELPDTLSRIDPERLLVGREYDKLEVKQREWFDKELSLEADIIMNIDDPSDPEHLRKAADIFWRLQQGQPLTFMETLHSRLYSAVRNFTAKHADDISYDFDRYEVLEDNRSRHPFFARVLDMDNDRMQHLALLIRMLLIEFADGPTDVNNERIEELVDRYSVSTIKDTSFEDKPEVKSCLHVLDVFYEIFKDDPMIDDRNGVKELRREYFVISMYLLLRHLIRYYAFTKERHPDFRAFVQAFHERWRQKTMDDRETGLFREYRRQDKESVEVRDSVARRAFFEQSGPLLLKDRKRLFDEAERISLYREARGLCQLCLQEGKSEQDARISWGEYHADHILPWILGGETRMEKAQVLCRQHNLQKGARQ